MWRFWYLYGTKEEMIVQTYFMLYGKLMDGFESENISGCPWIIAWSAISIPQNRWMSTINLSVNVINAIIVNNDIMLYTETLKLFCLQTQRSFQ